MTVDELSAMNYCKLETYLRIDKTYEKYSRNIGAIVSKA